MKLTKLSNSKMGQVLARLFKKEVLSISDDGKVQLSDEERDVVKKTFGEAFLTKLENATFDATASNDQVTELFDAAVAAKTASLTTEIAQLKAQNHQLQESVNILVAEPEPAPAAQQIAGAQKTANFKINPNAAHNAAAIAALATSNPYMAIRDFSDATIDISDLKSELTMAIPYGTKLDLLNTRIYGGYNDAKHFRKIESNGKDYKAISALISEVSQQFTPAWTPKGTTKFHPLTIPYRRHKINVAINPSEVIGTWLVDLYEQGKSPDQHPLVLYIVNEHVMPKVSEDITIAMLGKGKFVEAQNVQDGAEGTAAADSMDGLETILVMAKQSGKTKINFFKNARNILEIEDDKEFVEYIHNYAESISPLFRTSILEIKCSDKVLQRYRSADFKLYGKYVGEDTGNRIRFSTFALVSMECLYDSPILFATPKANLVMLVDRSLAGNCVNDVQRENYSVKIFGDYALSVGFLIAEAVFALVPDGYDPSAAVIPDPTKYSGNWYNGGDGTAAASDEGDDNGETE